MAHEKIAPETNDHFQQRGGRQIALVATIGWSIRGLAEFVKPLAFEFALHFPQINDQIALALQTQPTAANSRPRDQMRFINGIGEMLRTLRQLTENAVPNIASQPFVK